MSAITDQAGMQDVGANPGDFDDDEGGGLVGLYLLMFLNELDTTSAFSNYSVC